MHDEPREVLIDELPFFEWLDGTRVPIVRGGDGEGDDDGSEGGTGGTDGGGDGDGELDLDRAKAKIAKANSEAAGLRKRLKEAEDKAKKFDDIEDSKKSEIERLTGQATAAEQRAADAELAALRIEVALDKAPDGMPIAQVRKLAKRLSGTTREEFETDADELFEDFTPTTGTKDDKGGGPARRPVDRLRGGGAGDQESEPSVADIVKNIPRL